MSSNSSVQTWTEGYAYDRFGNRRLVEAQTKKLNSQALLTAAVDDSNRAVLNPAVSPATNRVSQAGYAYDVAGNLLCDAEHPCAPQPVPAPYFVYDGENKMISAGGGAQAGGAEYTYDGNGQRVAKVVGRATTVFVYDLGGNLIAEYSDEQRQVGSTSYLTTDNLGSTRVVTGQQREVKGRYDYSPFGGEVFEGRSTYGGRNLRQKFTGYERDDEIGLDYARARYFATNQGRFTSTDPLAASGRAGLPQSWNRYTYVLNNPLRLTDPDGLQERNPQQSRAQIEFSPPAQLGGEPRVIHGPFVNETPSKNDEYWSLAIGLRFSSRMELPARVALPSIAELAAPVATGVTCQAAVPVIAAAGAAFSLYGIGERIMNPIPKSPYGMTLADGTRTISCTAGAQALQQLQRPHLYPILQDGDQIRPDFTVVRGGMGFIAPPPGKEFSGAFGVNLYDAASGVPHGKVWVTTVRAIEKSGGSVIYAPEPAYPGGPINYRHVNVILGATNPFTGPVPNPVPKDLRIPGRP